MRIVATLTTIPSRLNKLMPTILSISQQSIKFDKIYLTLPYTSLKGESYSSIPSELLDISPKINLEIVRIPKDYGPVTKILGALMRESHPKTFIMSFDDDIIYPPNLTKELLQGFQENNGAAIASSGFIIGKFPFYFRGKFNLSERNLWFDTTGKMDYINGFGGILYQRQMFPKSKNIESDFLDYLEKPEIVYLKFHDDIFISGYLSYNNIDRVVISTSELVKNQHSGGGLSDESFYFIWSLRKAIQEAQNLGFYPEFQKQYSPHNTITGIWILLIIFILVIAAFLILCFYKIM